ncbi:MAG: response regulator [Magnetococcales bacterium]|nr:response regulator [Magnetococcales bacterium]
MSAPQKQLNILLVEDNPADAHLSRIALMTGAFPVHIHHVDDGFKAMAFLHHKVPYNSSPRPDLVLLDLNLPLKSGKDVLAESKSDPELCSIPVVVLTTSSDRSDVAFCYRSGANEFVTKPLNIDQFVACMNDLEVFWFSDATLPSR